MADWIPVAGLWGHPQGKNLPLKPTYSLLEVCMQILCGRKKKHIQWLLASRHVELSFTLFTAALCVSAGGSMLAKTDDQGSPVECWMKRDLRVQYVLHCVVFCTYSCVHCFVGCYRLNKKRTSLFVSVKRRRTTWRYDSVETWNSLTCTVWHLVSEPSPTCRPVTSTALPPFMCVTVLSVCCPRLPPEVHHRLHRGDVHFLHLRLVMT